MTTIPIPLLTFPVGTTQVGPADVGVSDSQVIVYIDRTVLGGLNSLGETTTLHVVYEMSFDSGANWQFEGDATFAGGIRIDPDLGQLNTDYFEVGLERPGTSGRQVRAQLTVAGVPVAIAGSMVVS